MLSVTNVYFEDVGVTKKTSTHAIVLTIHMINLRQVFKISWDARIFTPSLSSLSHESHHPSFDFCSL